MHQDITTGIAAAKEENPNINVLGEIQTEVYSTGPAGENMRRKFMAFKTKPCKFFRQERCSNGDACTYLHDASTDAGREKKKKDVTEEMMMVEEMKETKRKDDPFYKTKVCRFFQQGRCTKGDGCGYIHE